MNDIVRIFYRVGWRTMVMDDYCDFEDYDKAYDYFSEMVSEADYHYFYIEIVEIIEYDDGRTNECVIDWVDTFGEDAAYDV